MKASTLLLVGTMFVSCSIFAADYEDTNDNKLMFQTCSIWIDELSEQGAKLEVSESELANIVAGMAHEDDDIDTYKGDMDEHYEMAEMWATAGDSNEYHRSARRYKEAKANVSASVEAYNRLLREKKAKAPAHNQALTAYRELKQQKVNACDGKSWSSALVNRLCTPPVTVNTTSYCKRFKQ